MGKTWLADKARQRRFELERDEGQDRASRDATQGRGLERCEPSGEVEREV